MRRWPLWLYGLVEADLAAFEHQPVDAAVGHGDAAEGLRQHAAFATGDHRVGEEQVTGLELGVEALELDRAASGGEGVARFVFRRTWQDRGAGVAATAVQLQTDHGMGVEAKTDHARRVAGLEAGDGTLAPLTLVLDLGILLVAVEVGISEMQVQRGTFDEAISLGFIGLCGHGHRCGQCNEQRGETKRKRHRYKLLWSSDGAVFYCRACKFLIRDVTAGLIFSTHKKSRCGAAAWKG